MKDTILRSLVVGAILGLIGVLMVAMAGCATTAAVATKCAPATQPVVDVVANALSGAEYEAALVSLAADVGMCVLREAVEAAIHLAQTTKFAGDVDATVIVLHGQAWLSKHPG